MRPLLFQIPLPALRLSLWPALLGVGVAVALLALVAFRRGAPDRRRALALPAGVAFSAAVAALVYRDRALVVGPIEVAGFGALLVVALGLGAVLTQRAVERQGMSRAESGAVCVAAAVAGILGARVLYALLHFSELTSPLAVLSVFDGGLLAHGALGAGTAAAWVAARRRGLSPLAWLDAASPALAAGITLTRVGCWLEGCDFGRQLGSGAPAFVARLGSFPTGSPAWVDQVSTQVLSASAEGALPVHPAQLYEALGGALLLGLSLQVERRKPRAGASALAVLAGYAVLRVLVDFSRAPSREVWLGRFVLLAGLGVAAFLVARARRSTTVP